MSLSKKEISTGDAQKIYDWVLKNYTDPKYYWKVDLSPDAILTCENVTPAMVGAYIIRNDYGGGARIVYDYKFLAINTFKTVIKFDIDDMISIHNIAFSEKVQKYVWGNITTKSEHGRLINNQFQEHAPLINPINISRIICEYLNPPTISLKFHINGGLIFEVSLGVLGDHSKAFHGTLLPKTAIAFPECSVEVYGILPPDLDETDVQLVMKNILLGTEERNKLYNGLINISHLKCCIQRGIISRYGGYSRVLHNTSDISSNHSLNHIK